MKKNFTIALAAIAVLAFTSCKKNYTCNCKSNFWGVESTSTYTFKDTKSNATSRCNAMASSVTVDSMTMATTCSLQ